MSYPSFPGEWPFRVNIEDPYDGFNFEAAVERQAKREAEQKEQQELDDFFDKLYGENPVLQALKVTQTPAGIRCEAATPEDLRTLLNEDHPHVLWDLIREATVQATASRPAWRVEYEKILAQAQELMSDKTHDYDDGWRDMRSTSITDIMKNKVRRILQGEKLHEKGEDFKVSEDIEKICLDIINYAVFRILKERGY